MKKKKTLPPWLMKKKGMDDSEPDADEKGGKSDMDKDDKKKKGFLSKKARQKKAIG